MKTPTAMMGSTIIRYTIGTVTMTVAYTLCAFYSGMIAAMLAWNFIFKRHTRFWVPKKHEKPAALTDPRYGEHKFITVNGVKLHCVVNGSADKPLMLFIHGFPEFWYSWRHQIVEFSQDYRTVAVDMRGYGESDKPAAQSAYRLALLCADIEALIPELGYKTCTLVCHDWGAVVGWQFVQLHMDMIDRYVMMGAPSSHVWRRTIVSSLDQFRKSWYVFFFQMPWLPEFILRLDDLRILKAMGIPNDDLEAFKWTFVQRNALKAPIDYYRANLRFYTQLRRPKVDKYAPGLFLLGEKDLYIARGAGVQQQQLNGNLRFEVVPGANHFLQQDAPEETNALIRQFLRGAE